MRKWQSYYEIFFFPLIMLFVASVLKGVSGLILSQNFQVYFHITNQWVILIAEMLRYFGSYLMLIFPFLVLIKLLSKQYEDSVPVFIGVVSYLIFNTATMFFSSNTMPSAVYSTVLGIGVDASRLTLAGSGMRYPLVTGIFSVAVAALTTRYFYTNSRRRSNMGLTAFINRDAYALLATCLSNLFIGVAVAFIWPYAVQLLYAVFAFIARDITNPMNLFLYGILERLMTITCTDSVLHSVFWFGEYGGSWLNNSVTYLGDISVWTAQQAAGIYNTGFGRLITPYYVQSIFLIPMILLATFRTFTDKIEKNKYLLFLLLAILLSLICGNLFPIEVYLLIMTPLFYVFHVFSTGVLYAVLQAVHASIGYSYTGTVALATPGSIFDLLINIRNISMASSIVKVLIIGLVFGISYYLVLTYYYRKGCLDIMLTGKKEEYLKTFIASVGGIENIRHIYSTPTKVILQVEDAGLLNFQMMQRQGASKVVETRTTFDVSYGAISYLLAQETEKLIRQRKLS